MPPAPAGGSYLFDDEIGWKRLRAYRSAILRSDEAALAYTPYAMPGQCATVSVTAGLTIRSDLRARRRRRYVLVAARIEASLCHS
jgi:hypothetical protein